MTRLTFNDIQPIRDGLATYDETLLEKTGRTLFGIACYANGMEEQHAGESIGAARFAVVPMTCGEGIITTFSDTVVAILRHLGCEAEITRSSDGSGIAEAVENQATHLMMADDHRFVALDLVRRRIFDNAPATGSVFAAGLALMAGGLNRKRVLVIGCGPVGEGAAHKLISYKAKVTLCDLEPNCVLTLTRRLESRCGVKVAATNRLDSALQDHELIIDATNASGIIDVENITPNTYVSAPGMPLGLTDLAKRSTEKRLLHDPLQLGVASMAVISTVAD